MFCRNCGKEIKNNAKFCMSCGNKILVNKESEEKVIPNQTVKQNQNEQYTEEQLESIKRTVMLQAAKKRANSEILKGVIFGGIGLIITAISYSVASEEGTYFVLWGLVIYGIYAFFRGLYWHANPQKLIDKVEKNN